MASKTEAGTNLIELLSSNRQELENWARLVKRWGSLEAFAEYQEKNVSNPDITMESAKIWTQSVAEKIELLFETVDSIKRHSRPNSMARVHYDTWFEFIQCNKSASATARKLGLFNSNNKPNTKEVRDRLKYIWLSMKSVKPNDNFSDDYLVDMRLDGNASIIKLTYRSLIESKKGY